MSYPVSGARACGLLHLAVSSYYYRPHGRRDESPVRSALRRHAEMRRRWGYRRLLVLLRREGIRDNHKRVYRPYREERLQVCQRRRRKQPLGRGSEPPVPPQRPNERWSLDFIAAIRGKPASLITDNGPEFAGLALERWAHEHAVYHRFITPGKPSQNGYTEIFSGKLRDESLNEHDFLNLHHARELIDADQDDYNLNRPHSALDGLTPQRVCRLKSREPPMGTPEGPISPALAPESPVSKPTTTTPPLSFCPYNDGAGHSMVIMVWLHRFLTL